MTLISRREFATRGAALAAALSVSPPTFASAMTSRSVQPAGRRYVPRNLLTGAYSSETVASVLLPRDQWRPYPVGTDREAWEGLPGVVRRQYIEAGEAALTTAWPALPATLMLEYTRVGNRVRYDTANSARRQKLRALVLAETVEGRGRFLDELLDGIWLFCEQTFWGSPAHVYRQKAGGGLPDVSEPYPDLFVGEAASELAWAVYFLGPALDRLSPLIPERVHLEVDRQMLTPCFERDLHWMVYGFNWNPWCTHNWLVANLLLERNEQRRRAAVAKILQCLDNFLNLYPEDGGCTEGPGYWNAAGGRLFRALEVLHSATHGVIDIFQAPLVKEIGRYIYRVHIHDDWFINFADAQAKMRPNGPLLYRYGRRISDQKMMAFGAWAMRQNGGRRGLPDLDIVFHHGDDAASGPAHQPLLRDVWLQDIQVMVARAQEGKPDGFYLAAKGGHNAEHHNHNDVGNFIVFRDGEPVIIDVGVETYSAKTFSKDRYDIWTMSSAYHNLPTVNGVAQRPGEEATATDVAYNVDKQLAELSMNMAKAYPPEAGLKAWRRVVRLDRVENRVEVLDRHELGTPGSEITLSLMTPCPVTRGTGNSFSLQTRTGNVRVGFDGPSVSATIEEIPLEDDRLRDTWGRDRLRRILIRAAQPPAQADWRVVMTTET